MNTKTSTAVEEIKAEAREAINKCKDRCYAPVGRSATNEREGDYGSWVDWENVLVEFASKLFSTLEKRVREDERQKILLEVKRLAGDVYDKSSWHTGRQALVDELSQGKEKI